MLTKLEIACLHHHAVTLGRPTSYSLSHGCDRVHVPQKRCNRGIPIRAEMIAKRLVADPTDLSGAVHGYREFDDVVGISKFGSSQGDLLFVESPV